MWGARHLLTVDTLILTFILIFNVGDAHAFDDEWQNEVLKYKPWGQWRNLENAKMRSVGHENSGSGSRELKRR